jgi:hypothetical protein
MRRSSGGSDRDDSGFGGWRDWLLVIVGAPITVGSMVLAAVVGLNTHGAGFLSLRTAIVAVASAIVIGGMLAFIRR